MNKHQYSTRLSTRSNQPNEEQFVNNSNNGNTSSERMRRSRNLTRARHVQTNNNQINHSITIAKTSTERVREFRKRQRDARLQNIREQQQQQQQQYEDQQQSQLRNANFNSGNNIVNENIVNENVCALEYTNFDLHKSARKVFENKFQNNSFGWACYVCDRIWFKNDLKPLTNADCQILQNSFADVDLHFENNVACYTCRCALRKKKVPPLAKWNGFSYPSKPQHLPKLDLVSERLISPRLPFMQIRRLRHAQGQFGILGQIINIPVDVNNMVHKLPRQLDDDVCINVNIKRKSTHRSSYLTGLVNKRNIKIWLRYLISTPLFRTYNIEIDNSFFLNENNTNHISQAELSEDILIQDSLTAQQQTLMWNEDYYLQIAPGEKNHPNSLLLDEHAEEMSFPTIYLGQFRNFKESFHVTPFMMATSEMRRCDRRGVTPHHLLYVAMKIMRLRVRDSLTIAFKHVGTNTNITRQQIESADYINNCIEHNLAFLKSIPNSAWYWSQRKRDLFAMIRQFGKPTIFLTLSANEIGWVSLLQTLHKLKHNSNITEEEVTALNYIEKSTLVNDDAVTCALYFNKLVNILINILKCKRSSPLGLHFVKHYFKRIEFQHRGSPHAHVLLWLNEAPSDPLGNDMNTTITLIDSLISVSAAEASTNIKLQTHNHTFTCYKNSINTALKKCRFEYPFMPTPSTVILTPMPKQDPLYQEYRKSYKLIKLNLENTDYDSFESFYNENKISSVTMYHNIIRAGINRPRVFVKRHPKEKYHNNFNPFILRALKSNMDIQYILEEYSCAAYVSEYINKTSRGISNLQRQILNIMDENPEFSIIEITKKMSVNLLNTVEISSQEAAWYLLREPMCKASTAITYIPTVWPIERERIRKTQKELNEQQLGEDSTNIWKENIFEKYEQRPPALENVNLAQFGAYYSKKCNGEYYRRQHPKVIRYRNYDINSNMNDFKREMVTLFLPFSNEENDILSNNQFINIYNDNEQTILQNRNEFDAYFDIQKTIQICKDLCRNNDIDQQTTNVVDILPLPNSFQNNAIINEDLLFASLNKLGAIVKRKENVMTHQNFCNLMRMTNEKQKFLLLDVISHLCSSNSTPFQMFFTGPAGCGKTFVIKLLMEIYNRFCATDGFCNAYITCASTGKAAVAIDGVTVHTAFKISLSKPLPLSNEVLQQYRCLFQFVKVIIIDEISMISAELLSYINMRLQQINGNTLMFGGMDVFFIGDLRQLPPVRATPIFKQIKNSIIGTSLWRSLKYYELDKVMRQSDIAFSSILTKIGNGQTLTENELELIETRFFSIEQSEELCPNGIRLFLENNSVEKYNKSVLDTVEEKVISTAKEIYIGCNSTEQEATLRLKAHKMSLIDSGGIPYEIILVINKFYLLTSNIDVSDGLANGAYGKLVHIEYNEEQCVHRVWLEFPTSPKTGLKLRTKVAAHALASNFSRLSVPISRRTVNIPLNKNKNIAVKRNNFPIISACALTIHKSQGGTFNEIVYDYNKNHCQQLLYVALSRVTSISGLYITTKNNDKNFYHGRRQSRDMTDLQIEFNRLAANAHVSRYQQLLTRMEQSNIIFYIFNCQSLRCHHIDLNDNLVQKSTFLLLSETWLNNTELVQIQNFNCVIQFKRPLIRAGGVAVYHNSLSKNQQIIPEEQSNTLTSIGDISIVRCKDNIIGDFIIGVVYISPNNTITNIIQFLHESLLKYSTGGARLLNTNYDQLPFLLAGDFNTNFNSEQSKELTNFMDNEFNLKMNNLVNEPTTRHGSTIDAIFTRTLTVKSEIYTSYFSVHKPILSVLNYPPT